MHTWDYQEILFMQQRTARKKKSVLCMFFQQYIFWEANSIQIILQYHYATDKYLC